MIRVIAAEFAASFKSTHSSIVSSPTAHSEMVKTFRGEQKPNSHISGLSTLSNRVLA